MFAPSPTPFALCAPPADPNRLVVVAMSGGVDSAVVAGLLVEAGHRVVGMTMRLYNARGTTAAAGGRCCGPKDIDDARRVADFLQIPHYVVDLENEFSETVVEDFIDSYLRGETPNPCVKCNQYIKFTPLLERARAIGADALATGHYARILPVTAATAQGGLAPAADAARDSHMALWRGVDPQKDQSYFLFSMPTADLADVWFPLGAMTKPEVRAAATRLQLPNACKQESHEICFVPDGNYAGFVATAALRRGRPMPGAGNIVRAGTGETLGTHQGVHRFTIGQHKGLGQLITNEKLYVTAIDRASGTVTVGDYAAAISTRVRVRDFRWLTMPQPSPFMGQLQVRHRGVPMTAQISVNGSEATIEVAGDAQVAAPGQAAVVYHNELVIGGGWVAC